MGSAIMRGWQQRHQQTESGTTSPPAKCIIFRDQWAGPGKDNALTGGKKCGRISKQIYVSGEEAKRRPRECLGWTVAGDRSQQEEGRGQFQCRSSNCHRSHILTTDTVRTPHPVSPHTTTLRQWQRQLSPTVS